MTGSGEVRAVAAVVPARGKGKLRRSLGFVLASVRRHPLLFLATWAALVGVVLGLVAILPPVYEVRSKLLFRPSGVLRVRADGNPDPPTLATAEKVMRRENLRLLVEKLGLVEAADRHRAPIQRLRDAILGRLREPPTHEERVEVFVEVLEKRLQIDAWKDGTVNFVGTWGDPELAHRIVAGIQEAFLADRRAIEVDAIEKLIAILREHEVALQATVEKELAQLERAGARDTKVTAVVLPQLRELRSARERLAKLTVAKEQLELDRRRRTAGLRSQQQEKRGIYSEAHPVMVGLQQRIDALDTPGPDEVRVERELREAQAMVQDLEVRPGLRDERRDERREAGLEPYRGARFAVTGPGRRKGRGEVQDQAEATRARIEQLEIELDTARAAFPYRYLVVEPPRVPERPVRPLEVPVTVAAVLYGLFLALFAATFSELRSGSVREAWQLERALGGGVPVIEVRL
ncbi:MAG: hypothetical protein U0229_16650 [Anaeromyxobacter sp.]